MSKIEFNVAESRNGLPIIEAVVDCKALLLHSKYDPVKEAERFIDSMKEKIEAADHILFYGAGMGYHIKAFFERYPEKIASIYEPFEEIAKLTIQHKSKTKFPMSHIEHYVVQTEGKITLQNLSVFNTDLNHNFEMIVLPSYGKWQNEKLKDFVDAFKNLVDVKKGNIASALAYSRRWTINALMNLPKTMEHPNFLVEKKEYFKGKPAIIVSAGPSLSEEIENLRKIKKDGSAYIFSVGSAYKALIKENIYPDAICTYDPQNHNYTVFNELIENKIDTIPMLYGTTVGFETLDYYKGPKLYFPVSQDKLTVHFHKDPQIVVNDATTIAIVTLQLLILLEVSKIILVGQNFAFKNYKYYAEGIKRYDERKKEHSDNTANEKDLQLTFEVEDVHGGTVLTSDEFRRMKNDMEFYLDKINIPVINTTNGGAAIKGTTFKRLDVLMQEELTSKVVIEKWWKSDSEDSSDVLDNAFLKKYRNAFENFEQQAKDIEKFLHEFSKTLLKLKDNQVQRKLEQLDDLFQKYHTNQFYLTTIFPVAQLAFEKFKSANQLILVLSDIKKKAEKVIKVYIKYLEQCWKKYLDIAPIVSNYTLPKLSENNIVKSYDATSGLFHYLGDWQKLSLTEKVDIPYDLTEEEINVWNKKKKLEDRIELPRNLYVGTKQKGSRILFRFKGTHILFFGKNNKKEEVKLKISIDNKSFVVSICENVSSDLLIRKSFLSLDNLKNKIHNISIEILSESCDFQFEGIELNINNRAYHINEVERLIDLEIGKRIRCNYDATLIDNKVGEIRRIANETNRFLPIEPKKVKKGDFYFIMVDEINSKKKLIADRNVDYNINFNNLVIQLSQCEIEMNCKEAKIRLINVGLENRDIADEWIKYIKNNNFNIQNDDLIWNHERIGPDNKGSYSYITFDGDKGGVYSKYSDLGMDIYQQHLNAEVPDNSSNAIFGFRPLLEIKL